MGLINEVNEILKYECNINGFSFIFQDHGWTFANSSLDCSLFYKDFRYLIEQGNIKLVKSITLTITSRYKDINLSSTNGNTSYSDITRQNLQSAISFSLNEHNFPSLSGACQPILFNVGESRLYKHKPASNVKLVHVSPVYASSVSELVKPLNISKPVCSSNATKRNVCNASSVSQLTKPLNVSKPLCSSKVANLNVCNTSSVSKLIRPLNVSKTVCSKTTGLNILKVSSVSQLVKPSTVSKSVLSNNVRNVRNVNSINQLVKTCNVTKSICSSNASSSVIFNSTCKPVSDFVDDFVKDFVSQLKPARRLIDVNRKRSHERLINNISSRQHDFTKPIKALNILMMSI